MLDSHATALGGVLVSPSLLDRIATNPTLLFELVARMEQWFLLLNGLFLMFFVEKSAERQRREVDIIEIVSRNNGRIGIIQMRRNAVHLHGRIASTLENEKVAHMAAMAKATTHRAGFGLDRRVAWNEQNRDLN